ncbi:MAG: xylose isomerase [Spirochaetaceae bacterium]
MKEFFPDIKQVRYEGPDSKNPFAFKFYNPQEKVGERTMAEHLRFSMAYWHTLNGAGDDPFGGAVFERPWLSITDPMEQAKARMRAAFEIMQKLQLEYICFHDQDIAPQGETLAESFRNFDEIADLMKELMNDTGVELLWGTARLFMDKKYMHGAGTSPSVDVYTHAAAQVKKCLEVTADLGGLNYVFWGGREGYDTLLNTDMGLELDAMGRFLNMAADYAEEIGFDGQLLVEPKPKEPTTHQYDFDVSAIMAFLHKYGLFDRFKINVEQNHAILAGHTYAHEVRLARINDKLGSLDANEGSYLLGWDTDQFPTSVYESAAVMYEVLQNGGIAPGGLNFDAHLRRHSFKPEDIFLGFIAGMDTYARGLKVAHALLESGEIEEFIRERYRGWNSDLGRRILSGKTGLAELAEYAHAHDPVEVDSGRREMLESIINRYL